VNDEPKRWTGLGKPRTPQDHELLQWLQSSQLELERNRSFGRPLGLWKATQRYCSPHFQRLQRVNCNVNKAMDSNIWGFPKITHKMASPSSILCNFPTFGRCYKQLIWTQTCRILSHGSSPKADPTLNRTTPCNFWVKRIPPCLWWFGNPGLLINGSSSLG
jgi:hypothetical protein